MGEGPTSIGFFMELIWKCLRCGYITRSENPPQNCPDCNAPREDFVKVEED
jgi:rubrerythrin